MYPTAVEELAFQERSTLCVGAVAPVPVSVSATVGVDALLTKFRLADVEPLSCGVKLTPYDTLCPALSVSGSVRPLSANSGVVEAAELIVTLDPMAVTLPVFVAVCPTITLPKSILAGLTDSCPGALADPDRLIPRLGLDASEVSVKVPVEVPLAVGAKVTPKVRLCPAARD